MNKPIVLCYPHVSTKAADAVAGVLNTRWIGQGPKVDEFEQEFSQMLGGMPCAAVGSGTDALHLAYILANIHDNDEVIAPVFTCTATNIPLLYQRAKVIFADINPWTLNIDPNDVAARITPNTKAVVCVHYGGLPADLDRLRKLTTQHNIPLIEDAAHALGGTYQGRMIGSISEFTIFSFQAIKHFTTGDGGMLTFSNPELMRRARLLRWFGIDRVAKLGGHWNNDITEVGYKYQMTDIAAAMGLAGLQELPEILDIRRHLLDTYVANLQGCHGVMLVGTNGDRELPKNHAAWLCTIVVDGDRVGLERKLAENNIESGQMHYRNDRYAIFGKRRDDLPFMDSAEARYLVLPLHTKMTDDDVLRVCDVIRAGW